MPVTPNKPGPAVTTVMAATDFSDTADAAVDWAAAIARGHGARLLVAHALHLHGPMTDYQPWPADLEDEIQAAAWNRLAQVNERLEEQGLEIETLLEFGLPSEAILQAAQERRPDLLVVGSRGQGGFLDLLIGSTAQRIARGAICPVLTVHAGDAESHRAIETILVPTDFSRDAEAAAHGAHRLLHRLEEGARMILLHAYHLPVEYTAYGTVPTAFHFRDDVEGQAQERLVQTAEPLQREGLQIDLEVREGYPPEVIVEAAREHGVDLIAMGTHGRSGLGHLLLGSNAERVIGRAPCPVLTVRHPESGD